MRFNTICISIALALCAAVPICAQAPKPSPEPDKTVIEGKHRSGLMARDMPYRVVLPRGYSTAANAEKRWPVVYLLHGLTGHFDNWTNKNPGAFVTEDFIIVTPEGGDGWYSDSVTAPNDKYESYLIKELIPEIDAKYRTLKERGGRAVAGLSMGGYGAVKFGIKYPESFYLVGSFSGVMDAPARSQTMRLLQPTLHAVFGSVENEARWKNDIGWLVDLMSAEEIASLPFIYLDCGIDDVYFGANKVFADVLLRKKIPHEFRQLPGKHEWKYWNVQVQEFLRIASAKLVRGK